MNDISQFPSSIVAEEGGLVTMFVNPSVVPDKLAELPRALRVRLNPPGDELREDEHPFDLNKACAFAEERVLAPLSEKMPAVALTDVVMGLNRFTLGLRFGKDVDAKELKAIIESLSIEPWAVEEIEIVKDVKGDRERAVLDEIELMRTPAESNALDASLAELVRALPKDGSFVKRAGLDEQYAMVDNIVPAIEWLDARLVTLNAALTKAKLAQFPEGGRVKAYINCHPAMRQFVFLFEAGDAEMPEGFAMPKLEAALIDWLDAPPAIVRRATGLIWNDNESALDLEFKFVEMDASS